MSIRWNKSLPVTLRERAFVGFPWVRLRKEGTLDTISFELSITLPLPSLYVFGVR